MNEEVVDVVDGYNQVISQSTKVEAHRLGLLHRIVMAEVRNHDGDVVLVKQAPGRQDAGQLVSPVGGHVRAGESEGNALEREVFEEIGLRDFAYDFLGSFIFNRYILERQENHLVAVFMVVADPADFVLGEEAVAIETISMTELIGALKGTPEKFGGAFHAVVREVYPETASPSGLTP